MVIGEYGEYSIGNNGVIYFKNIFDGPLEKGLYLLECKNCIQIRTEAQYRILMDTLKARAQKNGLEEDIKIYNSVIYNSKFLPFSKRGRISLGAELVNARRLYGTDIVERCESCVRIWSPEMFEYMKNTSKVIKSRR